MSDRRPRSQRPDALQGHLIRSAESGKDGEVLSGHMLEGCNHECWRAGRFGPSAREAQLEVQAEDHTLALG